MSKRIALGPEPQVKIESVAGNLRLVGWDNEELLARVDDEQDLTLRQDNDRVTISCTDDLSLHVPRKASLHVQTINGDMSVRGLAGKLDIDTVNGDIAVRDVCDVVIGTIESDFSLRGARGDVLVKSVGGDASLRDVNGSLTLDSVSDDLALRGIGGNLKVDVNDDVVVHLEPKPGQEYSVVAGDDIFLVLPSEANATLTLRGDDIKVDWPGVETDDSLSRVVTLGDGSAQIKLDAGGTLVVTNREDAAGAAEEYGNFAGMMFDWGDWGRKMGEHWGNWGREMGEHWGDYGRDLGERMSHRAQETAERAVRKAEVAGRRAERHVERKLRHTVGKRRNLKWNFTQDSAGAKREPVSDEERMTILRMLAEKKITSEEAEKLLSALEGGQ
jgi:hypothetical protein